MTPWTSLFQAERTAFTRMINTRIWHCRTSSVITTLPSFLNCMRNMFNTPWFQGWFLVPGTVLHFCFSEIWTPGVLKDNSKDPSDNIYKELLSLALHCSGVHAVFLTFFFFFFFADSYSRTFWREGEDPATNHQAGTVHRSVVGHRTPPLTYAAEEQHEAEEDRYPPQVTKDHRSAANRTNSQEHPSAPT